MRVLVACEYSGRVRDAFRARGHEAWSCDLLMSESAEGGYHLEGDVRYWLNNPAWPWDMMIAFPPCTHLASSGARWWNEKRADGRQRAGVEFFRLFTESTIPKVAIENPVGIMSTQYRKPDQIIQPWQFGHPETKATCLWLKGLQKLVPTKIVEPDYMRRPDGSYYRDAKGKRYSRIHYMNRSMAGGDRSKARSLTCQGIADAMAEQWGVL